MSEAERPSEMKQQAGLRLRAAREHLDVTQDSLANFLGCSRTALTNWENGDRLPDVAAMVRLYLATGITLEWIFAGSLREMAYDRAEDLSRRAAVLGAVVGGPIAEWPAAVARKPGIAGVKPAAAAPAKRRPPSGWLHEPGQ